MPNSPLITHPAHSTFRKYYFYLMKFYIGLFFIFSFCLVNGQINVNGRVIDSLTRRPLAFVSLLAEDDAFSAAMTDIEGNFSIEVKSLPCRLKFSYVGYRQFILEVTVPGEKHLVQLAPSGYALKEMVITAGENPALRIIRNTWLNREKHDPEKRVSYRCDTYNKTLLTGVPDTAWVEKEPDDIKDKKEADSLFEKQHLFMIESYNERSFLKGKMKETITASKISGMKEASFLMLALKFQPFTFYGPLIPISGVEYVNPVSRNSEELYSFVLEDTLYNLPDTTFVISFKPRNNKIFSALTGTIYISAPDYAIKNVIATPLAANPTVVFRVQQQYQKLADGSWFPEQLNTDMDFINVKLPGYKITGRSHTFVSKVNTAPALKNSDFDEVTMEVQSGSSKKDDIFWEEVRIDQLTEQEQRTYRALDSISKKENFEFKFKAAESLIKGYVPIKWFDLDLSRILRVNAYEGLRLGAGGLTNSRISEYFSVGGYYAYGFRDKASKYGGEGHLYIYPKKEVTFNVSWNYDVNESGGSRFISDRRPQRLEGVRNLLVNRMDREENTTISLSFRSLKYVLSEVFVRQSHSNPLYNYSLDDYEPVQRFSWFETGLLVKISRKEQFYRNGRLRVSLGTKLPVYRVQIVHGQDLASAGALDYTRVEFRMEHKVTTRRIGTAYFQINAGMVDGTVPYSRLFNGRGNQENSFRLAVASVNCFETMGMNEFLTDRYAAFFFQQDFGPLFSIKKFKPSFGVVFNSMAGTLKNPSFQKGITFKVPEKGFFETGLLINNLLTMNGGGYGIGGFYRLGQYASANWKNNIALKLMLSVVF